MATLDDVRRLALALPRVEEDTRWGNTSWGIARGGAAKPKGFVWERPFSKADIARDGEPPAGAILAAMVESDEEKRALLAAEPGWLFTIQHFDGFPAVLVRLDEISDDRLAEVVVDAWLAVAPPALRDQWLAEHPPA